MQSVKKETNNAIADPGGHAIQSVMFWAARLLGLRVRIPPGAWMSLSCECCVVGLRSLRQADPSSRDVLRSLVCLWDLETSTVRRPRPE